MNVAILTEQLIFKNLRVNLVRVIKSCHGREPMVVGYTTT